MENVVLSASRIAALAKYLVALSASLRPGADYTYARSSKGRGPSGRRQQLHILYLINDLLHHTKHHLDSSSTYSSLVDNFQSYLINLFSSASAYSLETNTRHHRKIQDLLDLWHTNEYYQSSYIGKLREAIADAVGNGNSFLDEESATNNTVEAENLGEEKKDPPYIMPSSHGDYSTPFYDLPAANMLPHIMPNSITPINPQMVKPLQFRAGPADETLISAIKDFLRNVDHLDEVEFQGEEIGIDVDELGQHVKRDELTGDILEGDGYYGWSRVFCEKMKKRKIGFDNTSVALPRDSDMDKHSHTPKRRNSDSASSGKNRRRSRSWSNSVKLENNDNGPNVQTSTSRSRSRSRSPLREMGPYRSLRSRSRSMSSTLSYSPPPVIPAEQQPAQSADPRPLPRGRAQEFSPPQPPPLIAQHFPQGFPPLGPGGLPIPPPPPPNYKGQWPPPPPSSLPSFTDTVQPHSVPTPSPPTGPRMQHNHTPSGFPPALYNNSQGQLSQDSGGWEQLPQQSGPGSGSAYGSRGRAQPPSSGREFGYQGRSR